jgi:hypothetical protein
LIVDLGQHKDKSKYYYSFKTLGWTWDKTWVMGYDPQHGLTGSTWINVRIKIIIITVLKSYSKIYPRQCSNHWSRRLTRVNIKIKIVIIIILKLDWEFYPRQGLSHGFRWSTRVNDKNSYYHYFKNRFRVRTESWIKIYCRLRFTRVNVCIKVINYYYNFKTRFENRPRARPKSLI